MSDFLGAAFDQLEDEVLRRTRLPGLEAAYATVRRRRRQRFAFVAAAVAMLLVLVPVFVLRAAQGDHPDIGPSPVVTVSPTASPAPTPPGPPAMTVTEPIADLLAGARLEVPAFSSDQCPSGSVQFQAGAAREAADPDGFAVQLDVRVMAVGDVNGDTKADVVARIGCRYGRVQGMTESQVLVFTRSDAALIGQVAALDGNASLGLGEVLADGSVRIAVSENLEPVTATPPARWHTYRWDGTGFEETGVPVDIPVGEPTALSLTATTTATAGRVVTFSLTVHNGGTEANALNLTFFSGQPLILRHGTVEFARNLAGTPCCVWVVFVAAVPPGETATGTFTLEFPPAAVSPTDVTVTAFGFNGRGATLPSVDNTNRATLTLTV